MSNDEEKIQVTINVIGMTCTGCARTLENVLRQFDDIDYSVNFPERNVVVRYSPATYRKSDFENAIESRGYRVEHK